MTEFRKKTRVFIPFETAIAGRSQLLIQEYLPEEFHIKSGEYVEIIIRKLSKDD